MPEGPEVRKYADALDAALTGRAIVSLAARTKDARKWLLENEQRIIGRRVERVVSHGKHLVGYIEDRFFFHSHLMMWGRWQTRAVDGERYTRNFVCKHLLVDDAINLHCRRTIFATQWLCKARCSNEDDCKEDY